MTTTPKYIGQSVPRREDRRLLSGRGQFIADIQLTGALHAAFARSDVPHAHIRSIDVSKALALDGVVAVLTAKDLEGDLLPLSGMQNTPAQAWRDQVEHRLSVPDQPILAGDKVHYVGEPYAVVLAESRYIAEDAVELIEADFEALPVVGDIDEALRAGAPVVHSTMRDNIAAEFCIRKGSFDGPHLDGLRRLKRRFTNHRFIGLPMECRGVVAQYDLRSDSITVWMATQVVHWVRREIAKVLNLPEARVRCIAPDVGGGFGVKGHAYPEDALIPYLARRLQRPVQWIEDRHEHILNSTHARDDRHDVEVAFTEDGRIVALRDHYVKDTGSYTPVGMGVPASTASHMMGQYIVPNFEARCTLVCTNKTANAPYRGAGKPEGAFVMERVIDLVANELGLDPVIVRQRNMIPREQMPYNVGIPHRDGNIVVYDSGDFPRVMAMAVDAIGLEAFRKEQREARAQGRYLGLGLCCYVEETGSGPHEGAIIRIDPSGGIIAVTGSCSAGHGHETVFSQVVADQWGVRPEDVTVVTGDTGAIAYGFGTFASRSTVTSSAAIEKASQVLLKKVFAIVGNVLECAVEDLELRDGGVAIKGSDRRLSFKEIARAGQPGWDNKRPAGMSGGLEATEYFEPSSVTWAYATHAVIVEVDAQTGKVSIRRYVVSHDAGVIINPLTAKGQILGGICQGIGGTLLERVVYSDGQLLTASLLDYVVPTASDTPFIELHHVEIPTPLNVLGIKGLGEGGIIGPPAAIANAVSDALKPIGFEANCSFVDQGEIVAALKAARAQR